MSIVDCASKNIVLNACKFSKIKNAIAQQQKDLKKGWDSDAVLGAKWWFRNPKVATI